MRTGTRTRELAEDRTEDRVAFARDVACERFGDGDLAHDLAFGVNHLRHQLAAFTLTDCETITSPFFEPGIGPRTSSKLRSESARTTSRF